MRRSPHKPWMPGSLGAGAFSCLLACVAACGPGSAGTGDDGDSSSSESSSSESAAETSDTNPESGSESTTEPMPDTTDECDNGSLDWCDDGDFGEQSCDLFAQDCPEGEKCVPHSHDGVSYDDNICVPVTGAQGPGEPCMTDGLIGANDDCDATGFCLGFDQDNLGGTCHPFCTGDVSMPECIDGWACEVPAVGPSFCAELCVPLAGDCSSGSECVWTGSLFSCVSEGPSLGLGEVCAFVNDCMQDALCVDDQLLEGCAGDGCCTAFCSLMAGDAPCQAINPNYTCQPFFQDPPPPGYEDTGVCVLP